MSVLRVKSIADLPASVAARNRGKAGAVVAAEGPARVPGSEAGAGQAQGAGSGDAAPAQGKEGWLMLPYPVPLNRAYRNFKGRMVMSAEARAWKEHAKHMACAFGVSMVDAGPVDVSLILHPRMNRDGSASRTRQDLDAIFKLALDSMQGVAYADDKQVNKLSAWIGAPVSGGGLSVRIKAL